MNLVSKYVINNPFYFAENENDKSSIFGHIIMLMPISLEGSQL